MALRRRRAWLILILAVAGITALTVVCIALFRGQQVVNRITGPKTPAYVRADFFNSGSSVYFECKNNELRTATTAEGLNTAVPVGAVRTVGGNSADSMVRFPEIALPIPANQFPAGVTAVKATFCLYGVEGPDYRINGMPDTYLSGEIGICRTDDQQSEWQYVMQGAMHACDSADKLPDTKWAELGKVITFSVKGKSANAALGVGVSAEAGTVHLSDIRKDGIPVDVHVTVLDASGKKVASGTGPLSAYGFSGGGNPCYSVRVAKGSYTCLATLDVGPFGGILKAERKIVVP